MTLLEMLNAGVNVSVTVTPDELRNFAKHIAQEIITAIPEKEPERIYTDKELQELTQVSRIKLWNDRKAGRLPFIRIGNMIRYKESDVKEYLSTVKRKEV